MASTTKRMTRLQLSKVFPSLEMVKAFENLQENLVEGLPAKIEQLTTLVAQATVAAEAATAAAEAATATANAALAATVVLSQSLSDLAAIVHVAKSPDAMLSSLQQQINDIKTLTLAA